MKRILRYPNFTMVGHHYVLPIAKEHRGEIQGSVHRTSASNETVFVEPQAIAEQSAQLSFLRAKRGEGDPPHPPLAQRPGRPGGRLAPRHAGDPRRARPDLRPGPLQPRLPDVAPRLQPGRPARPPRGPAPAARSPLPRRAGAAPRPASRSAAGTQATRRVRARLPPPAAAARAEDRRADRRAPRPPVPDPGRHRAEHGRQDGRAEDGGPAGGHGAVGPAHPGAPGLAAAGLRRRAGRHRRRAEPRAVALDLLVAHPPGLGDPRARRPSSRWSCSTRWAPGPTPPKGPRSAGRSSTSSTRSAAGRSSRRTSAT